MIDTFIEIFNNRIIDQLKAKFAMINDEKRRIHLRHLLTQAEIERKIDFSLHLSQRSKRNVFEMISSSKLLYR